MGNSAKTKGAIMRPIHMQKPTEDDPDVGTLGGGGGDDPPPPPPPPPGGG
jgi:hypothetical protein